MRNPLPGILTSTLHALLALVAIAATQCPLTLSNLIASESKGNKVGANPVHGFVAITQANAPQAPAGRALLPVPGVVVAPGGGVAPQAPAAGGAPGAAAPSGGG